MKTLWTRAAAWRRDTRGAVYVEFLAVFFPLFTFFMSLVQFAFLQTASIIVTHSAMKAARMASVAMHGDPADVGGVAQGRCTGARLQMIADAARYPLIPLGSANDATVTCDRGTYGPDDMITITVTYDYLCRVPLGRFVACGVAGSKTLTGQASMPNQGAEFNY